MESVGQQVKVAVGPRLVKGSRFTIYQKPGDSQYRISIRQGSGWVPVATIHEDGTVTREPLGWLFSDRQRLAVDQLLAEWGQ